MILKIHKMSVNTLFVFITLYCIYQVIWRLSLSIQ